MEMHQVRYFLALCETLNFTRAAERCNVSQPSLTRAIKGLEDEFGGPLFHRERNNTHLTELGRTMRPYLQQVWQQKEEAHSRARDFKNLKGGLLTLGLMCTLGPHRLVGLIQDYNRAFPGLDLQLRDATPDRLTAMLDEGELDVALFAQPETIDGRFHAIRLYDENFVIAFAAGHRFAELNAVRLKDLHGERYLSRVNCEFGDHMLRCYEEMGVQPVRPYRSERDDWIQSMALAGMGFNFIPQYSVTLEGLLTRPLVEPEIRRTVHLVTVRGRPHSPAVGAFVREAVRHKWNGSAQPPN
ncbi:MAG: LysR family transcriptional regulator [Alphaproteobacteria bacterium]|nr:LysR family transcriptional regulator [Alphaproteobacteria bacterium]